MLKSSFEIPACRTAGFGQHQLVIFWDLAILGKSSSGIWPLLGLGQARQVISGIFGLEGMGWLIFQLT
jgi:hypothetical protein